MGDRALIIFKTDYEISPTVYLHWGGCEATDFIGQLSSAADGKGICATYAAARFVGIAHQATPGVMSLGVQNTEAELAEAILAGNLETIASYSHGDAGILIVNVEDYSWEAYGGYLAADAD